MDLKRKHRAILRSVADKAAGDFDKLLSAPIPDEEKIQVNWELLTRKFEELSTLDQEIYGALLEQNATEEELTDDMTVADSFFCKYSSIRIKFNKLFCQRQEKEVDENRQSVLSLCSKGVSKRKFKLPSIEFKRFSGEVREWLSFWNQFKKIDEDPELDLADKIEYLHQATITGSRARRVVESFPAVAGNYSKIIDALRARFGREDLQIEVCVRDLLKIVLDNATAKNGFDLSFLYDKLETHLRALETLGVTADNCAAILFPLIESCLPEDLIRIWQRSSGYSNDRISLRSTQPFIEEGSECGVAPSPLQWRLEGLMSFIRNEVENEQRVSLASDGFGLVSTGRQERKTKPKPIDEKISTAAELINCEANSCIFCAGFHDSGNCYKAQKMTLEEKKEEIMRKRACYRCVKKGHQAKRCRGKQRCLICNKSHLPVMCPELPSHKKIVCAEKESETVDHTLTSVARAKVFLQTLRVIISSNGKQRYIRLLVDSGSQRSYILKTTVAELGCSPKRVEKIVHTLFGGRNTSEQTHYCYDVKLSQGEFSCMLEVLDQPLICCNIDPVASGVWVDELKSLNIRLSDVEDDGPIEMLIGADIAGKLYTGRRHILKCGLVVLETRLGWTLMGKFEPVEPYPCSSLAMTAISLYVKDGNIPALWDLDVLGIKDPGEKKTCEDMTEAATESFLRTVNVDSEGRYEVKLPWAVDHAPLPDNYAIANKRLETTIKKLKNCGQLEGYDKVFQEWLQESIIERVFLIDNESGDLHYLPHRPVFKENSTTKIRPVFDASSREKDKPSLNHCLEKGSNLIESIPDILIRFRELRLGVVSDIRKAFLQIGIQEADRDFLRFLWIDSDGHKIVYRHRRVVFGVTSSPFILGAIIKHHLTKSLKRCSVQNTSYSKETIEKLLNSFYVDNCVTSMDSISDLKRFIQESSDVMSEAFFDLRGWEYTRNDEENVPIVNVLGLNWNCNTDKLFINDKCIVGVSELMDTIITKRIILSAAQRMFDPIGFTCPTALYPKLLLQRIWKQQLTWDTAVNEDIRRAFLEWVKGLPYLLQIQIPRWVSLQQTSSKNSSLHAFCDASGEAYAAVIFLRAILDNGEVVINLLAAKSRVAPLKKMTIPRLELMGATIAARLCNSILDALGRKLECTFWTDSSTVISWIRRSEEWKPFVGNRVKEIRFLTSTESWRHIPGLMNPADLPSRGCSAQHLLESKWWEGPDWLYQDKVLWPREELTYDEKEIEEEKGRNLIISMVNGNKDEWNLLYFSKYLKIIRMVAWIFRFIHNVKNPFHKETGGLNTDEVDKAELFVLARIQSEAFDDENDQRIRSLHPFRSRQGLIQLQTRISRRKDYELFRFPIVLPAKHPVINRLIYDLHVNSCHIGTQGLLGLLREKYWILGGRRTIRSVISKCVVCKRYEGDHFQTEVPVLPLDRVRDASIFEVTGLDFAGPLHLKDGTKAWICLFTCAIYRAVHLELVTSLSTASFLQALRRFIARRGRPRILYSDNGTAFVGAENAFAKLDWSSIEEYSTVLRIRWKFNPPTAAWWGGFWERMIGVLKRLLRKVLGRASLSYEELQTIICDCESIINSRPISYMSADPKDLTALTPNMFLTNMQKVEVPDCDAVDRISLCARLAYKQKLRDDLRDRFRSEYLGQLSQTWSKKTARLVRENEVVLIGNDHDKRLDWPIGRIVEILPGPDGQIRLVRVQTSKGLLLRPVQRIFPLECGGPNDIVLPSLPPKTTNEDLNTPECNEDSVCAGSAGVSDVTDIKSRAPVVKITKSGRVSKLPKRFQ